MEGAHHSFADSGGRADTVTASAGLTARRFRSPWHTNACGTVIPRCRERCPVFAAHGYLASSVSAFGARAACCPARDTPNRLFKQERSGASESAIGWL